MKKTVFALSILCFFAFGATCIVRTNAAADTSGAAANFRSYNLVNHPQEGFSLLAAHAKRGVACIGCHDSDDPIAKPDKGKWPSAAKCLGCHKIPAGAIATKDYKTNVMRTFDPHNNHEKGGCLTCHSEHFASRLSCNVGACHDFKDVTFGKSKSSKQK